MNRILDANATKYVLELKGKLGIQAYSEAENHATTTSVDISLDFLLFLCAHVLLRPILVAVAIATYSDAKTAYHSKSNKCQRLQMIRYYRCGRVRDVHVD